MHEAFLFLHRERTFSWLHRILISSSTKALGRSCAVLAASEAAYYIILKMQLSPSREVLFEALHHSFLNIYITVYPGPPPPSGTVHSMFCFGSLMSHACRCSQLVIQVRRSRGWKQIARYRKEARQASLRSPSFGVIKIAPNTIGLNQSRRNIVRSFMRYPSDARQL